MDRGFGGRFQEGKTRLTSLAARLGLAAFALAMSAQEARAECLTLASGPIVYDVAGCGRVEPEKHFDTTKEKYAFIAGLDPAGRKQFLDTYRGLLLKGKVVKSNASTKGVTTESNVLAGQNVLIYLPPSGLQCDAVAGKRLQGNLREACCDGNGDIPCLLNTSYLLLNTSVVGSAASGAGDSTRQRAKKSKDVQAGDRSFAAKKWKDAAKAYETARGNGDLDVAGHYKLGYAYRELDQCRDAIPPLRQIYDMQARKEVWADEEGIARKANFLLARCYAKMNEPSQSVLVLNGYLLEPEKYRAELRESTRHKDFGWIHTSKEFREYKKQVQKKLKKGS